MSTKSTKNIKPCKPMPSDIIDKVFEIVSKEFEPQFIERLKVIGGLQFDDWWRSPYGVTGKIGPFIMFPVSNLAKSQIINMMLDVKGINKVEGAIYCNVLTMDPKAGLKTDDLDTTWKRGIARLWKEENEDIEKDVKVRELTPLTWNKLLICVQAYNIKDLSRYSEWADFIDKDDPNLIISDGWLKPDVEDHWDSAMDTLYSILCRIAWRLDDNFDDPEVASKFTAYGAFKKAE